MWDYTPTIRTAPNHRALCQCFVFLVVVLPLFWSVWFSRKSLKLLPPLWQMRKLTALPQTDSWISKIVLLKEGKKGAEKGEEVREAEWAAEKKKKGTERDWKKRKGKVKRGKEREKKGPRIFHTPQFRISRNMFGVTTGIWLSHISGLQYWGAQVLISTCSTFYNFYFLLFIFFTHTISDKSEIYLMLSKVNVQMRKMISAAFRERAGQWSFKLYRAEPAGYIAHNNRYGIQHIAAVGYNRAKWHNLPTSPPNIIAAENMHLYTFIRWNISSDTCPLIRPLCQFVKTAIAHVQPKRYAIPFPYTFPLSLRLRGKSGRVPSTLPSQKFLKKLINAQRRVAYTSITSRPCWNLFHGRDQRRVLPDARVIYCKTLSVVTFEWSGGYRQL